jgi:hypothetical protein
MWKPVKPYMRDKMGLMILKKQYGAYANVEIPSTPVK